MANPQEDVTESLRPIEMEASIDAELAAMNRGNGMRGAAFAAVVVAAVTAAVVLMKGLDEERALTDTAAAVDALEEEHLGAFENCTLTGMNRRQIKGELALVTELDHRSRRLGGAYARTVRRCLRHLDKLVPALTALDAPAELHDALEALTSATTAQKASWQAHLSYLEDEALAYDSETARPALSRIAADWRALHEAHAALTAAATQPR